jgi:hypothetical protein
MDYVTAKIALGGDQMNIMYRGPESPVSWPEVRVLQHLHGDDCVFDCDFVRSEHSNVQMEKMRLLGLYGAEVVNLIYPGARPMIDMEFPGDKDLAGQKRPERRPVPSAEVDPQVPPPLPPLSAKRPSRAEV